MKHLPLTIDWMNNDGSGLVVSASVIAVVTFFSSYNATV